MKLARATLIGFVGLGPAALAAHAQSSLTMYGLLDAGVVGERGCDGCSSNKVSGGAASGSRLGLSGREALGGGDTVAVFTLEAGLQNDTGRSDQNGLLFGRQAFVGVDGRLGALTAGRQYNLQYLTLTDVADPFQGGMAGSAANLVGYSAKRWDNTVKFVTPALHGITAGGLYSYGASPYNNDLNRSYGAMLGYADGPVTLRIAHQRRNNLVTATGTTPAVDRSARNTLVAANINFGIATAYAGIGRNRGDSSEPWDPDNPYGALAQTSRSTDSRDTLMGLSVPFGALKLMLSYIRKDDRDVGNQDANQAAIGVSYAMSKQTDVYAAYAKIRNRNGAGYTVGNATDGGRGDAAFNLGLRHGF